MTTSILHRKLRAAARVAPAAMSGVLLLALWASPCAAVTITVANQDFPGEGFNDATFASPVGGNTGNTLGQQRLNVFQYAADAWGQRLAGTVPVVIDATFDPLDGDETWAVLGGAGPTSVYLGFPNAERASTWFVSAVANQQSGGDLDDSEADVSAQFNSDVDGPTVLGDVDFYYGLDGNNGTDIDFLSVVLHEIGHGLGFLDLLDETGAKFNGNDDAFMIWLEDPKLSPKALAEMNDAKRALALVDTGSLLWFGPSVKAASSILTSGRRSDGRVQMYAPNPYEPGSSVAHFDVAVSPNELMEPFATGAVRDLRLTSALLDDVGWTPAHVPDCADANDDDKITSSDALLTLRTAVGSSSCAEYVCDVNSSGSVTAADALLVLKLAVGQAVEVHCPLA
ncbi:MAG: hypothetical protein HY899_07175 [Deltaproteobacteria bacterium]|nr:hypothetical protein [Deltaproteobacteria bacterium]